MDKWASQYGSACGFVCVSCAGQQLASTFGNELKLRNTYNTWVTENDMPMWGQLGCSGFILIDGADRVICNATSRYLDVHEDAFRHVETLLDAYLEKQSKLVPESRKDKVSPACSIKDTSCQKCGEVRFGNGDKNNNAHEEKKRRIDECVTDTTTTTNAIDGDKLDNENLVSGASRVKSVKVDILDNEHHECETQLALLESAVTSDSYGNGTDEKRHNDIAESLASLLAVYEAHFRHEEKLLDEHLYADVANKKVHGFSADKNARTSHFADHKRMLSTVRELLDNVSLVNANAVLNLKREFERHANTYDGGYADRLSAALAA